MSQSCLNDAIRTLYPVVPGIVLFKGTLRQSFVEDEALWPVADCKCFQGSIKLKHFFKVFVDYKRLTLAVVYY